MASEVMYNREDGGNWDFTGSNLDFNAINYEETSNGFNCNPSEINISKSQAATSLFENDEPPLLDELEIYPARILEKVIFVVNPLHTTRPVDNPKFFFEESDMAGPLGFWLIFAAVLFVTGAKAHFGYVYGLTLIAVGFVYLLAKLMCFENQNFISVMQVASILGYSFSPIILIAFIRIFFLLHSTTGYFVCVLCVLWASSSCSRLLCMMMGDTNQRLRFLMMYPSALIYASYLLLVLF